MYLIFLSKAKNPTCLFCDYISTLQLPWQNASNRVTFKQQIFIYHSSKRLGNPRSRCTWISFKVRAILYLCFAHTLSLFLSSSLMACGLLYLCSHAGMWLFSHGHHQSYQIRPLTFMTSYNLRAKLYIWQNLGCCPWVSV